MRPTAPPPLPPCWERHQGGAAGHCRYTNTSTTQCDLRPSCALRQSRLRESEGTHSVHQVCSHCCHQQPVAASRPLATWKK